MVPRRWLDFKSPAKLLHLKENVFATPQYQKFQWLVPNGPFKFGAPTWNSWYFPTGWVKETASLKTAAGNIAATNHQLGTTSV